MAIIISVLAFLLAGAIVLLVWQRNKAKNIRDNITFMLDTVKKGNIEDIKYAENMTPEEVRLGKYLNSRFLADLEKKARMEGQDPTLKNVRGQLKDAIAGLTSCQDELEKQQHLGDKTVAACDRAADISEKLHGTMAALSNAASLGKSRVQTNIEQKDVSELLNKVRALGGKMVSDAGKNIAVDVASAEDIYVNMDVELALQAIGCILDNAVKYTPSGGKITVATMRYEQNCRIDITDTGPGISMENQIYVFRRYWRAEENLVPDGLGLGLFMAKELITAQNGYIRVSSSLGKGSTFSVFLPLVSNEEARRLKEAQEENEGG